MLESICALEQDQPIVETHGLNRDEIQTVLSELKSIMAVYQG